MSSPPCQPAFLTIPPGISPAALLDSPVMIPNSLTSRDRFDDLTNKQLQEFTKKENLFDQKAVFSVSSIISPSNSDDGYTWRKYGQKHVKGSKFPRSYYKCTQQNCPVRKKVECAPDGQVIEIVYTNGTHNHPKTQTPRRSNSFLLNEVEQTWEENVSVTNGLKRTSSTSGLTELSDPLSTNPKSTNVFDSAGTPELSSTLTSYDCDDDDLATQEDTTFLGDDVNDYDLEPKRRKKESTSADPSLMPRTVREPKVVVQVESEIDILDDGYRWRKYGQKVVKGNPNPRSYYKCTCAGCPVRKHVERASDNLKSVITTYEGKHNHKVPSANKNTNGASGSRKSLKDSNFRVQVQDLPVPFERKHFIGSDQYLRPSFFGSSYLGDLPLPLPLPLPSRMTPLGDFHFNDYPMLPNSASRAFLPVMNQQRINDDSNNSRLLRAKEEIQWT